MIRGAACVSMVFVMACAAVQAEEPIGQVHEERLPPGAVLRLGDARLVLAGAASGIAFSPDGATLAVASERGVDPEDNIHVFDLRTGLERLQLPSTVRGSPTGMVLEFSHDGKKLWSGDAAWDTTSWQQLPIQFPNRTLAISPDDKYVALHGQQAGELVLWDPQKATQIASATISTDEKESDNKPAANNAGNNAAPNQLAMRNFQADSKKYLSRVIFAADGKSLTVSNFGGCVQLREVPSLKLLKELPSRDENVARTTAFSPDLRMGAVADGTSVTLFDVASGKSIRTCGGLERNAWLQLLLFSPDGKSLIGASRGRDGIFVWETASGKLTETIGSEHFTMVDTFAFSRDGRFLAIGGVGRDSGLRVLDWATKKDLFPASRPHGAVANLAYSPNSRQIAIATADGQISLYDTSSGRSPLVLHDSGARSLAFSRDGWVIGAIGPQGSYHLRAADTGEDLVQRSAGQQMGMRGQLQCAAMSPLLDNVGVGLGDGHLRIQAAATGAERQLIQAYTDGSMGAAAWSPDGKLLATARGTSMFMSRQARGDANEQETIQLWDAATGKLAKQLVSTIVHVPDRNFREGGFLRVVFSPDGSYLAAIHSTGPIVLWDTAAGRQICEIQRDTVGPFCFSADSQMLLYVEDNAVQMAELASAQICLERKLPALPTAQNVGSRGMRFTVYGGSAVTAIAAAPDGKTCATSLLRDDTTVLWSLAPDGERSGPLAAPANELEIEQLWNSLAKVDAKAAYVAMWRLALAGDQATAFIHVRLPLAKDVVRDDAQIARLIADLDSDTPEVREKATEELTTMGSVAEPLLRQTLTKHPSLEQQTRVEHLLAALDSPIQRNGGEPLRRIRAIRVLERIGTPQAAKLLGELATGSPTARETRDAKRALERKKVLAKGR